MERLKQYIGIAILAVVVGVVGFQTYTEQTESDEHWQVPFSRGDEMGSGAGALIAAAAEALDRDDAVIIVTGHTGTRGDPEANRSLSLDRAEAVRDALVAEAVPIDRIIVIGIGADEPLPPETDETDRAYQLRLGRAEILITDEPPDTAGTAAN